MPALAYEIGLRPWEFDRLTPLEFEQMVDGYRKRRDRDWYQVAWMVAHLLAPHRKRGQRALTPEKLLGLPPRPKRRRTPG